jgi:hypothetical protein
VKKITKRGNIHVGGLTTGIWDGGRGKLEARWANSVKVGVGLSEVVIVDTRKVSEITRGEREE